MNDLFYLSKLTKNSWNYYDKKNVSFSRIEFDSGLCNAINEDIQDENDNIEVK